MGRTVICERCCCYCDCVFRLTVGFPCGGIGFSIHSRFGDRESRQRLSVFGKSIIVASACQVGSSGVSIDFTGTRTGTSLGYGMFFTKSMSIRTSTELDLGSTAPQTNVSVDTYLTFESMGIHSLSVLQRLCMLFLAW